MEPRELSPRRASDPMPQAGSSQAPDTLWSGLQGRLEVYRRARATPYTPADIEAALHDPRWEVRCAAAEQLSASTPLAQVEQALSDEEYCVRLAAVRALGRMGTAVSLEVFQRGLRDSAWQVREMALLTAQEYGLPLPVAMIEEAARDESAAVRDAARAAREERIPAQQTRFRRSRNHTHVEREDTAMSLHTEPRITAPSPNTTGRKRLLTPLRAGIMAASLLLALGILTAASFSLGWWSPRLGHSLQYTSLNQEQTINGVTVRLLKVYLDQGRTVVVYDILSPSANQPFLDAGSTATSAYPQKAGGLPGGGEAQIDRNDPRLRHQYTVYRPFVAPQATSSLTVTWTVEVAQANESLPKGTPQPLRFTFNFTAPFHQTNNQQIVDPFKSGAGA